MAGMRDSFLDQLTGSTYETMYFITRKKFFNGAYMLQAVVSCIFILRLVFDEHYKVWDKDINDVLEMILTIGNAPLYKLDFPAAYIGWGIATALLLILFLLGAFLSYGLANSSLDQMWVVSLFRGLLGFGLVFYFMPLQAWLAWARCDYFEGVLGDSEKLQNIEIKDTGTDLPMICFDSNKTQVLVLSLASFALSLMWTGIVLLGALVHVNDPRSWSLVARPHCWCELLDYSTGIFLLFLATFLTQYPAVIAIFFVILRGSLAFFTIKVQPYYNSTMTDLKAALFVGQIWVGILFFVASLLDPSKGTTIAAISGFPGFCGLGLALSKWYRGMVMKKVWETSEYLALKEEAINAGHNGKQGSKGATADTILSGNNNAVGMSGEEHLATKLVNDNEDLKSKVWGLVDQEFVPGVTMSVWSWFAAVHVEVQTRFLQDNKCQKLELMPAHWLLVAENLYLTSLENNPQSAYLALQYVTFITSYTGNFSQAGKCLDDNISSRMKVNLGLGYSVFRKRKDIDRLKRSQEEENGGDGDAIGYAEIAAMQKEATIAHTKCEMEIESVWTHLNNNQETRSRSETQSQRTELLEKVVAAENRAEDAYIYVLERCKEAVKVYRDYARFLADVKADRTTARLMVQRAEELDKTAKNDEAKSQGSESRKSDKGEADTLLLRRTKKLSQVGWLKIKLRLASFLLFSAITALFVDYIVSILDYESTLVNLNESGSRRFYCQYAAMDVREMLIDARLNRSKAFEYAKNHIRYEMDLFLKMHINLAHKHKSTHEDLMNFYAEPQAAQVVSVPNPKTHSWTDRWRPMAVSGTDAPFRVISEAYLAATMPMSHFNLYDKSKPSSAPEVAFLLENVNMVARGLDDGTALYQMEASYVAEKMRIIFIILSALSGVIEIILVVFIFRRAVVDAFDTLGKEVTSLADLPQIAIDEKIRQIKAKKVTRAKGNLATGSGAMRPKGGDSDLSDDSELESEAGQNEEDLEAEVRAAAAAAEEENEVSSVARQQLVMSLFYYLCMLFLCACLTALCALCIVVVNNAERSASEINNGSRRRWLGMRLKYFSSELIWNGPDYKESHMTQGAIKWLNTIDTIQCLLRRSAEALLSVHYGMIYGRVQGFVGLPKERGFSQDGLREWGPKGSVDMCSPFTWSKDHFDKSIETTGSIARYKPLDTTYFEENCLTFLDPLDIPTDSFVMTNERMQFFSKNFKDGRAKCEMYNARCRYLNAEQLSHIKDSKCKYYRADGSCEELYYDAGKNKRVNSKSHLLNTVKQKDPCGWNTINPGSEGKEYPDECYTDHTGAAKCKCDDGSARDYACPDQVGTQGLHNYVLYLAEHAMTLATKPEHELTANNEEYEIVRAYDNDEWELGNLKAVLLHQHEAISDMHTNTTITEIVYAFLVVVIGAQYFFLGKRIENLMIKHDHVGSIVKRLRREGTEIAAAAKSKKDALKDKEDEGISDDESFGSDSVDDMPMKAPMKAPAPQAGSDSSDVDSDDSELG